MTLVFPYLVYAQQNSVCVPRSHVGWVASGTFLQVQRRHNNSVLTAIVVLWTCYATKGNDTIQRMDFVVKCVYVQLTVCVLCVCELRLREIERRESITQAIDLESA